MVKFGVGIGDPEHNFQMEGRGRRLQLVSECVVIANLNNLNSMAYS